MKQSGKIFAFIPVLFIGAVLQFFMVKADSVDTPEKAAMEFISAYYKLDAGMAERLCKADSVDGELNLVEAYVKAVNTETEERGYTPNYMKFALFHVEKETKIKDDKNVEVKIVARKYRAIRDFYPFVSVLFGLGQPENIEHDLKLIKEDGKWKVCGFSLL